MDRRVGGQVRGQKGGLTGTRIEGWADRYADRRADGWARMLTEGWAGKYADRRVG